MVEDEIRGTVNKETHIYYWHMRPCDFLNAETMHYGLTWAIRIRLMAFWYVRMKHIMSWVKFHWVTMSQGMSFFLRFRSEQV